MGTDEFKRAYRARASLVELADAHVMEQLGLDHVLVRGIEKVTCVSLMTGLAFDILQNVARLLP